LVPLRGFIVFEPTIPGAGLRLFQVEPQNVSISQVVSVKFAHVFDVLAAPVLKPAEGIKLLSIKAGLSFLRFAH